MLGQPNRLQSCTPSSRARSRGINRGRESCVGMIARQRQVQGVQFRIGDHLRECAVKLPSLLRPRTLLRHPSQQRVRCADTLAVDYEQSAVKRVLDRSGAFDGPELGDSQIRAQRHGEQQPGDGPRQRRNARSQHILHRVGHRHVLAHRRQPVVHYRTPQLEDEQRITQRRVHDPAQKRARQRQAEPAGEQLARRTHAHRPDVEALKRVTLDGLLERTPTTWTPREQKSHRLVLQPPGDEHKRISRRRIQPLEIVDRDHQRLGRRERPQSIQQPQANGMGLRGDGGRFHPQQRHLERRQLRCRQTRQHPRLDPVK